MDYEWAISADATLVQLLKGSPIKPWMMSTCLCLLFHSNFHTRFISTLFPRPLETVLFLGAVS